MNYDLSRIVGEADRFLPYHAATYTFLTEKISFKFFFHLTTFILL